MDEFKCLFSAITYIVCQVIVCVLKPVLGGCQFAADKCGSLAQSKLATMQELRAKKEDHKE